MEQQAIRYRVGIDVGLMSVGLCAVEIDDSSEDPVEAMPLGFLSIMSVIHDGAIDPSQQQSSTSRKATSGVQRRARTMKRRRRKRLDALDVWLEEHGYPVEHAKQLVDAMEKEVNPYVPWNARITAANGFIENEQMRLLTLTVAIRHIARHRGWRNPFTGIDSLAEASKVPSPFYIAYYEKLREQKLNPVIRNIAIGEETPAEVLPTPAQLIQGFLSPEYSLRSDPALSADEQLIDVRMQKLHQSDYYGELKRIFEMQRVPSKEQEELLRRVFDQTNPRDVGAAAALVANDDLQPDKKRASVSSIAFQRFRVIASIQNLRIKEGGIKRRLTQSEVQAVYGYLTSDKVAKSGGADWMEVAEVLGLDNRSALAGLGGVSETGEALSANMPPFLNTIKAVKYPPKNASQYAFLQEWWDKSSELAHEYLVDTLGNAGAVLSVNGIDEERAKKDVDDFLESLDDSNLELLEKLDLKAGRVAYSIDTLCRLTNRMLSDNMDLHEARKAEFGVDDDWRPRPNTLGTPTGNPAADRTIKIVSRWLKACVRKWGVPETINIEHVREGFKSKKVAIELEREMNARRRANETFREKLQEEGKDRVSSADVRRLKALQRQNLQCLYCGAEITFDTCQMDHIVPRKGAGSSSVIANLVATCESCNKDKSNTLFSKWANDEQMKGALERVSQFIRDADMSAKSFASFKKEVKSRLKQKEEDEPLDTRSIESVAWMARELRDQVSGFIETCCEQEQVNNRVLVFRGQITAEARKASGLEKRLPWHGGSTSKTRLDRRHHAVDAAVIAMMRPGVAMVLAERELLRREQSDLSAKQIESWKMPSWKKHTGFDGESSRLYAHWKDEQMERMSCILSDAMMRGDVVVTSPLRLRIGMGRAHEDTIYPFVKKRVGDALSAVAIDKAETPALWVALTRQPDYSPSEGLPQDETRCIRVHDKWLSAQDEIRFMAMPGDLDVRKDAVYSPVRNGFAKIGCAIHHGRLYAIPTYNKNGKETGYKYAYLRVFQQDLLKHASEDLFEVEIPQSSISWRSATYDLRIAAAQGRAEYLGWFVVDDEIQFDEKSILALSKENSTFEEFMRTYPRITRFKITGLSTSERITIAALELSAEGDEKPSRLITGSMLAINRIMSTSPLIIRRNARGEVRWTSDNNMPISWRVPPLSDLG